MQHLLEPIAEAIHWGRNAQRAPFVTLKALPAASGASTRAGQRASLLGLQSIPSRCMARHRQLRLAQGSKQVGHATTALSVPQACASHIQAYKNPIDMLHHL